MKLIELFTIIFAQILLSRQGKLLPSQELTQQGASIALNRLIARGLIVKKGSGHNIHYILAKDN